VRLRTTCRSGRTMATRIWPYVQAHDMPVVSHNGNNNKAWCASAQHAGCIARWATTIRPCAQLHNMPVSLHYGGNDMALCASAGHASCVARWQQLPGLVRKCTTCRLHCTTATMIRPCAQVHNMLVVLHDGDDNNNSGDKDNKVNEYHHTLCTIAPGFQPSCASAQATASNIDATTN
jgi:hypothetical protein